MRVSVKNRVRVTVRISVMARVTVRVGGAVTITIRVLRLGFAPPRVADRLASEGRSQHPS